MLNITCQEMVQHAGHCTSGDGPGCDCFAQISGVSEMVSEDSAREMVLGSVAHGLGGL